MDMLKSKDSQRVEIRHPGKYILVREGGPSESVDGEGVPQFPLPEQITIPFLLKYYRFLVKNLTQKELAQQADVTPNQISNIEKGKIRPHKKTIQKLAMVLGNDFLELAREILDNGGTLLRKV